MAATGVDGSALFDLRLHWAPLTLAAIEGPLAVGASGMAARPRATTPQSAPGAARARPGAQRVRRIPAPRHRAHRVHDRAATRARARRDQGARGGWVRRGRLVRAGLAARHPHPARPHPLSLKRSLGHSHSGRRASPTDNASFCVWRGRPRTDRLRSLRIQEPHLRGREVRRVRCQTHVRESWGKSAPETSGAWRVHGPLWKTKARF
jgi:hypothetical protein